MREINNSDKESEDVQILKRLAIIHSNTFREHVKVRMHK